MSEYNIFLSTVTLYRDVTFKGIIMNLR